MKLHNVNKCYVSVAALLLAISHFCAGQKRFEKGVNILQPGTGPGIFKTEFRDKSFSGSVQSVESARGIDIAGAKRTYALRTRRIELCARPDFGCSHSVYDANNI